MSRICRSSGAVGPPGRRCGSSSGGGGGGGGRATQPGPVGGGHHARRARRAWGLPPPRSGACHDGADPPPAAPDGGAHGGCTGGVSTAGAGGWWAWGRRWTLPAAWPVAGGGGRGGARGRPTVEARGRTGSRSTAGAADWVCRRGGRGADGGGAWLPRSWWFPRLAGRRRPTPCTAERREKRGDTCREKRVSGKQKRSGGNGV